MICLHSTELEGLSLLTLWVKWIEISPTWSSLKFTKHSGRISLLQCKETCYTIHKYIYIHIHKVFTYVSYTVYLMLYLHQNLQIFSFFAGNPKSQSTVKLLEFIQNKSGSFFRNIAISFWKHQPIHQTPSPSCRSWVVTSHELFISSRLSHFSKHICVLKFNSYYKQLVIDNIFKTQLPFHGSGRLLTGRSKEKLSFQSQSRPRPTSLWIQVPPKILL